MTNANAAWSTTTKATAKFSCVSNCEAGGLGKVASGTLVVPFADRGLAHRIGAWPRTILIQCKIMDSSGHGAYYVTVQDKNWGGAWEVTPDDLSRPINNTNIPQC